MKENAMRDQALEEAAKIADDWCERNGWPNGVWGIAAVIRARKSSPPPKPRRKK